MKPLLLLYAVLLAFGPTARAQVYPSTDTPLTIPDNNPTGVTTTLVVPPGASTITDLDVRLDVTHSFVGDLRLVLSKGGVSVVLLDRPRFPGTTNGCGGINVFAFADDEGTVGSFESACVNLLDVPAYETDDRYTPNTPLAAFDGQSAAGTWTLTVSDLQGGDTGMLDGWALIVNNATGATVAESGDAGDLASVPAQDARNRPVDRITGSIPFDSDEDCYAITVTDPGLFSANVVSFDPTLNSQLFLFDANRNGVFGDDDLGRGLLSAIDVTEFAAGGGASGDYVLCITGYDNDPENAASVEIFPEGSGTPIAADPVLASWDNNGFVGAPTTYDVRLTGVTGSSAPALDLEATALTSTTVPPGGSVQFEYAITNSTAVAASGDLFFVARNSSGAEVARGRIASGTVQGGATVTGTFTQRVPSNAPPGNYAYTLNIGRFPSLVVDGETFAITVTGAAPLVEALGGLNYGDWSRVEAAPWQPAGADVRAAPLGGFALSAVHPNPFRNDARFTLDVAKAQDVRVEVYDGLGRRVAVLHDGALASGTHALVLDGSSLPSGIYVVRAAGDAFVATRRATVLR